MNQIPEDLLKTHDGVVFKPGMTLYRRDYDDDSGTMKPEVIHTTPLTHEVRWGHDGYHASIVVARIRDDTFSGLGKLNRFYADPKAMFQGWIAALERDKQAIDHRIEDLKAQMEAA